MTYPKSAVKDYTHIILHTRRIIHVHVFYLGETNFIIYEAVLALMEIVQYAENVIHYLIQNDKNSTFHLT